MIVCVFCQIVAAEGPANIVQEWRDALAITPLNPVTPRHVTPGHVLVIPKEHIPHALYSPKQTGRIMELAAEFAQTRPWDYPACNILTSVGRAATQSVMHLHVHVVPRWAEDGLMLPWGTVYGDDPAAPHWCRVAQGLKAQLDQHECPS